MTPTNHHSNFPATWWNERRKRDYYVDADGLVQLRKGSPTSEKLCAHLTQVADALVESTQDPVRH